MSMVCVCARAAALLSVDSSQLTRSSHDVGIAHFDAFGQTK